MMLSDYTIAVYLRISREDITFGESNSIKNQRELIKNYIESRTSFEKSKIIEYIDDGFTGSNTERPAYRQLMKDVNNKLINCIIVKDLSRIGRSHIEVDELLANLTIICNVRFIAINDNYDNFENPMTNMELSLMNLINQQYIKDLAVKSITSKFVKMKKGEYLSVLAIYGYKKSETEKNKLVIDKEAAEYVKTIFELALVGKGTREIAKILNERDILTPSDYKKTKGIKGSWNSTNLEKHFWSDSQIGRILKDERYTGKQVSAKQKVRFSGKKLMDNKPKEEWIIVHDAHDAIISENDFNKVQELINQRKLKKDADYVKNAPHIFRNKIKCGTCGFAMVRIKRKEGFSFVCKTKEKTKTHDCFSGKILESDLEDIIIFSIREYVDVLMDSDNLIIMNERNNSLLNLQNKYDTLIKSINSLEKSIVDDYTKYISNKIDRDKYIYSKENLNAKLTKAKQDTETCLEQINSIKKGEDKINDKILLNRNLEIFNKLSREILDAFVDKIFVFEDKNIEIAWKFEF